MLLKDCFFGPQHTIDAKLGQNTEQVAWKNGTIARKTEKKGFFFSGIENHRKYRNN